MPVKPEYTAVVLVVDLFPAPGIITPSRPPSEDWDHERVREHIEEWGDTAIDFARGLSPRDFTYMCLFINKYDLITPRSAAVAQRITEEFSELIERLQARSGGVEFGLHRLIRRRYRHVVSRRRSDPNGRVRRTEAREPDSPIVRALQGDLA